ncbi:hypothetical protein P8C59_006798 [Phyllachora maydis]|uniref:ATP synthase F0 n=1 Tax=Phyllachora maydis TaxID=1825666 RepID=A0AAD9I8U0_9PEZI|nr:hypothetical protein P8C59_006798 [Phyllachora maydis]
MADGFSTYNPFARRESHHANSIATYRVLTSLTWLLSLVVSVYYWVHRPHDGDGPLHRIPTQNDRFPTGFTLNDTMLASYWSVLLLSQVGYVSRLFSADVEDVKAAASVGSHFIANNLVHFAFVMLFVRGYFGWAEVMLVANFVNLTSLYFRHNAYARLIHMPAVSGPLAWTFVALFWNGAIAVYKPNNLMARIFANMFIWSILGYGLFFIFFYKDYTMGFNLSVLSAAIGVGQFLNKIVELQWMFAFTIMTVLLVLTALVAYPAWSGGDVPWGRQETAAQTDAERAPLLNES